MAMQWWGVEIVGLQCVKHSFICNAHFKSNAKLTATAKLAYCTAFVAAVGQQRTDVSVAYLKVPLPSWGPELFPLHLPLH